MKIGPVGLKVGESQGGPEPLAEAWAPRNSRLQMLEPRSLKLQALAPLNPKPQTLALRNSKLWTLEERGEERSLGNLGKGGGGGPQ